MQILLSVVGHLIAIVPPITSSEGTGKQEYTWGWHNGRSVSVYVPNISGHQSAATNHAKEKATPRWPKVRRVSYFSGGTARSTCVSSPWVPLLPDDQVTVAHGQGLAPPGLSSDINMCYRVITQTLQCNAFASGTYEKPGWHFCTFVAAQLSVQHLSRFRHRLLYLGFRLRAQEC